MGRKVWWCFVIFQPSITTNVRHHDRCEWLNITMLVSLCSSNIFVDHRSYSLIGYFLTTRFREGVPLKHLKKISKNAGRCNQHCSDWMVCWPKICHRQRCSRLLFWYILMNCRPFQRKSFGTWYLYSKKVLGKFCQHFPCKLKPIPLGKKSRAPNRFAKTGPITILSTLCCQEISMAWNIPKPIRVKWTKNLRHLPPV